MVVRILDHVRSASTYEDGDVIYRLLIDDLTTGGEVTVSFAGVTSVPSAFINGAFVRLLETLPFDVVRSKLKILDSTRQINDLLRSRFEFVADAGSAPAPVREGIYRVRFGGPRDSGDGMVVVKGSTVNGGDAGFSFAGRIFGTSDDLAVDLKVKRWNVGHVSVFGNLTDFNLTLAGKANAHAGTFAVSGSVTGQPSMRISIVGQWISAAA